MSKVIRFPVSNMPQALNSDEVFTRLFHLDRANDWKKLHGFEIKSFIQSLKQSGIPLESWDSTCRLMKMNNDFRDAQCELIGKPEGKLLKFNLKK